VTRATSWRTCASRSSCWIHAAALGTDVATLVNDCLDHGLLRPQLPVTWITITPTTRGEYRDGAFLVLADIDHTITLASTRIDPHRFTDPAGPLGAEVLDVVAATVDQLYAAYLTTAAGQAER
jgi:hypothetical protein